jgi:thioredoxin 1
MFLKADSILETERRNVMIELEKATKTNYEETVGNGVTLVDFNAPWCAPCRAMAPVIDRLEKDLGDKVKFVGINIDENQEIAREHGIQSIPTLIVYKEGSELNRMIGLRDTTELNRALAKALE